MWVRVVALVAVGLTVLGALAVPAVYLYTRHRSIEAEREKRIRAPVFLDPGPLPKGLPLVGPEGTDGEGYPTQFVDRRAMRALSFRREHAALDAAFEHFQSAFEQDPRHEYWPNDAIRAFGSSEPELGEALDAWVAAAPDSFGAHAARAEHLLALAFSSRGLRTRKETPSADMAAMDRVAALADAEFRRAIELRPRLVAAYDRSIRVRMASSTTRSVEQVFQRGASLCPSCFVLRASYIQALRPRWGGSHEQMAAFARGSVDARNPRLKLLAGFVDLDLSSIALVDGDVNAALEAANRACALGDYWEFLLARAQAERRRGENAPALEDLARAEATRPGWPELAYERVKVHSNAGRPEEAALALLDALRVEPTDGSGPHEYERVLKYLLDYAKYDQKSGDARHAARMYDLAVELAPEDLELRAQAEAAHAGAVDPDDVAEALRAFEARPDDYDAAKHVDDVFAARGQFRRILPVWARYLEGKPRDPRAWLERCGTHTQLRMLEEAIADCRRSCELGDERACRTVRRLEAKRQ